MRARDGWARALTGAVAMLGGLAFGNADAQQRYGFGQPATPASIAAWNIDVAPDGRNLPAGSATIARGKAVYDDHCVACHGAQGEGGLGDRLVGGQGTLASASPVKTVGSYWPYATTLFDYVRRAMPFNAPHTLTDEEVYAATGYVLFLNGLVPKDATIDANLVRNVTMPNRAGFVSDPRPDIK
jgi:S-disulfanyl-L-cysteine oxidoreductase SoxD